jgi:hypothetical protein
MNENNELKLFEDKKIRAKWNDEEEKWYFSVVDIVAVLTENDYQKARTYWKVLKSRLLAEGNETVTNCNQLKMMAYDGKLRLTDVANIEQILRIIQSIPSKKAEPFKLWLAQVGAERLNEIADPEIAIQRSLTTYRKKGYSDAWISQRLRTIEMRKELTDEWDRSGIQKGIEYAILTDEISKSWSGMTTREYKNLKGLKKENLRDNMTNMELVLNMLAEVSTTEISKSENPQGFEQSKNVAKRGGNIAKEARKNIEEQTGKPVITSKNAAQLNEVVVKTIEAVADDDDEE